MFYALPLLKGGGGDYCCSKPACSTPPIPTVNEAYLVSRKDGQTRLPQTFTVGCLTCLAAAEADMIACLRHDKCVCLSERVRDGVRESEREVVFDPFSQLRGFNFTPGAKKVNLRAWEACIQMRKQA